MKTLTTIGLVYRQNLLLIQAAGLPVVTLGHQESSVVKMALGTMSGLCSTASDVETLSGQLLAALSEPCPKSKYRGEILRCTSTNLTPKK